MVSLPVPTDEEVRTVLRRDWTMTLLALATMWAIVALATVFAVWSAVTNAIPIGDPQILLPFLVIAGVFWSVPAIATYVTYRRRRPTWPR
jgi:hypothetical protein